MSNIFVNMSTKLELKYVNEQNRDVLKYEQVFSNMTVALNNVQNNTVIRRIVNTEKFVFCT